MRNLVILILLFVFGSIFIAAIFEAVIHFNKTGDTPPEFHELETNGSATVYNSFTLNYDGDVTSREHDGQTTLRDPSRKQQRNFNVNYATSSGEQTTTKRTTTTQTTTTTTPGRITQISVPTTSSGTYMIKPQNELVNKNRKLNLESNCTQNHTENDEGIIRSQYQYPQDERCFTWYIDVGAGYSIDITISVLDLDGSSGDYLMLSPSPEELGETSNPVFTWYLKTKRLFRVLDRGTAFIMFKTFSKTYAPGNQGFEIHYARYGNATTPSDVTTQPALPTPPAGVDQSAAVYISLVGGVNIIEEFYNRSIEFRSAVSEMASVYCNETGIHLTVKPSYVNVILNSVNPCQLTWPDSSTCLRIRMTVPVNNTNTSIYELTSKHVNEMWNKHSANYLASSTKVMKVYQPPDGSNFTMWIVVSAVTVVVFSIFLALIWKIDIFKESDRESKIVVDDDLRRPTIDNVLISVPPLYPADKFDPENHKTLSWNGDIHKDSITSLPRYGPPKGFSAAITFMRNLDEEEDEVHYERIGNDNRQIHLSDEPKLSTVL